jgi:predicted transcriptional regulator
MAAIKRTIEVDDATATALESRAAEAGVSVSDLLAGLVARQAVPVDIPAADIAELDRQWAAVKSGEPTVPHTDVVRWLETWGTSDFRPWQGR